MVKRDIKSVNVAKGSVDDFEKNKKKNEKNLGVDWECFQNDEKPVGFSLFCQNVDFPLEVMTKFEVSQTLLYKRLRTKMQKCKKH